MNKVYIKQNTLMHSISYLQIDEKNYLSLCKKWVNKDKKYVQPEHVSYVHS